MNIRLIPQPQQMTVRDGFVAFAPKRLGAVLRMPVRDERLVRHAGAVFGRVETQECEASSVFSLTVGENPPAALEPPQNEEGYSMTTAAQAACVRSVGARGLFYGLQTLRQLMRNKNFPAAEIVDWPEIGLRSDYLDLRSIYPKFDRLLEFVREMAEYKINTLVIEYEDKLPFETMPELCHPEALTPVQFRALLEAASENFMDVIPLQQTFGHLEYVLKHPQYKRLRETPETPGEMCPLREGAFELAAKLLNEIARLHPGSRYLHIGCDEVWSLGSSEECRRSRKSREEISLEYINRLVQHVCSLGKIPIMWHDMLQKAPQSLLDRLDKRAVVGVWMYSDREVRREAPALLEKLRRSGLSYLACSASRSYDDLPWQNYPCAQTRLRNVDAWCELARSQGLTSLVNTNWAASFSLGRPYGLFETSRYPAFYGADRSWNLSAETGSYLERFLSVYHGIDDATLYGGVSNNFDYYSVIPSILDQVMRNKPTAQLIELCARYEEAFSVACSVFRGELFPDSEVELDCLRERSKKCFPEFDKIARDLKELASQLLSPKMGEIFLASRTYPYRMYRRELEKMLGIRP